MSNPSIVSSSQPLATLFWEGAKQVHSEATGQGSKLLLSGQLPRDDYIRFLMMLWYVYDSLERALDRHAANPVLETTYNPALFTRLPALTADIAYLLEVPEDQWKSHPMHQDLITPTFPAALQTYLDRLNELADSPDPSPLLGHSYVRYLGDLSGGQLIKRVVTKAYGLDADVKGASEDQGVSFYTFKELRSSNTASAEEMKRIKDWFKDGVNTAGEKAGEDLKPAIVAEARNAFRLNIGLFSEISNTAQGGSMANSEEKRREASQSSASNGAYSGWTTSSILMAVVATSVCLTHYLLSTSITTGSQ